MEYFKTNEIIEVEVSEATENSYYQMPETLK